MNLLACPAFRLFAGLAALAASSAFAQTAAPSFAIPAKQIDVTGAKYLKTTKKVFLPTAYVEVMHWGKISSVTQTSALQTLGGASNSTSRSTMEVAVPSDVTVLRSVAGELYDDLAAKLRAAGWEVVTHADVKSEPAVVGVKQETVDAELGVPIRKVNLGKQKMHYSLAAPEGMPVIDRGMTAPLWGLRNFLKEKEMIGLETTYRFDPVALQASSDRGLNRISSSTSAEANLVLTFADCAFLNNKWAGGSIRLKSPIAVVGGVGEIKKAADASPHFANGLSKALSILGGGGSISSKKGLYVCELDEASFKASLLLAGKSFNDEIVKGLAGSL